jgi:hypothetical protein
MPFTSLTALPIVYPFEARAGGLIKAYLIAYSDTAPDATGQIATVTSGLVTAVSLATGKLFQGVGFTRGSSMADETFTSDFAKGTGFYKSTFKMFLSGLTVANQQYIQQLQMRPVAVIIQTLEGNFYLLGGDGRFQLLSYSATSGTAEADGPGYTLSFEGSGISPMLMVDPSIIATITAG